MLELSPQQRYDDSVWTALTLLTDHKYPEAVAAFEQAQRIQDTDQLRQEIARVKARLDAARTADRTIHDIQTILADGMADEAARLAGMALREFGASEKADVIIRLKRQADALVAVSLDGPARVARFRQEADEATRADSLRAAAVAYEQCAAAGDAAASSRLTPVRANLDRYDDARRQAAEFAVHSANSASRSPPLKMQSPHGTRPRSDKKLTNARSRLLLRRERLSVAEFDTRGDVGAPRFGQTIAEELAPAFKPHYDLVDVGQVARVCSDLQLATADILRTRTAAVNWHVSPMFATW